MSYASGHNLLTSLYLLSMYIYCRPCRLCVVNVGGKEKQFSGYQLCQLIKKLSYPDYGGRGGP
jgi:hypothetical protein